MAETPTYASLTPMAPANPTILNGLGGEIQSPQQLTQSMINSSEQRVVDSLSLLGGPLSPMSTGSHNSMVTSEIKSETGDPNLNEKMNLLSVMQFLRKNSLKVTEDQLRKECGFFEDIDMKSDLGAAKEISSNLACYKNEGDPTEYEDSYQNLVNFVEKSMDVYKYEVSQVMYPVFVHMYLELVYNEHENLAMAFLEHFGQQQEDYFSEDILGLALVTKKDHITGYQIMDTFRSGQYILQISRDSYSHLKRFLNDNGGCSISRIIQDRIYFDVYDGVPRSKSQVAATAGALEGEASKQVNKTKIFYGLLKEPELQNLAIEEEEGEEEGDKPRKKKNRKDPLQKNKKNDPNAPISTRIPLPELRDIDKLEKAKAFRDAMKRIVLSKENLPSICFYTFLNSVGSVTSLDITDDSSLLAYGSSDSVVCVHSITPTKLKTMKSIEQLNDIDKYADDVLVRMMDERSSEPTKQLMGHTGPIYGCSFSPDRSLLLTASRDGTIRLWSLQTWTCMVVYKGHIFPVWDVKFCHTGYYFASGGHDRTARLWATDHHQPLRIFAGHHSDVDVIAFHPNGNYVASGSSDRSIRLWDTLNGNCVRILTGHKGMVNALCISPCGRYLASGSSDKNILVWDLAHGSLVAEMSSHTDSVHTVGFSRDCSIIASGGLDCCIKLWDFNRIIEDNNDEENSPHNFVDPRKSTENLLLATFPTKNTPVFATHFTRRNVLLSVGAYDV